MIHGIPRFGAAAIPLAACALALANNARAQDVTVPGVVSATPSAPDVPAAQSASNESPAAPAPASAQPLLWTLAATAGVTSRDDGPEGTYQIVSLNRQKGPAYFRASLMHYHGTLQQADIALPSRYYIATLGTGGNFHNWVVDAWASLGQQDYGEISTSSGSRPSNGARHSLYYGFGGDFGRVVPLAPNWFMTATVNGSHAMGKLLRPSPSSAIHDLETSEPTWNAGGGLRTDYAFGANREHYIGLGIAGWWTSNAVSDLQIVGVTEGGNVTSTRMLTSVHHPDVWWEVSAASTFQVTRRIALDVLVGRSFDNLAGNTTTAGASLRIGF